jgi:HD-like signal output (HDOD) protein
MEQLLDKLKQLPPLPDVCIKLGQLVEDPRCTAQSMAALIEKDAALTADLLRLSNSAFYAVPGGIKTVQRAVTTLGFSAVHQFALCMLSNSVLKRAGSGLDAVMAGHARAVSAISVKLATDAKVIGREMALAAGLLHDVGRMAAQVLLPEKMREYQERASKAGFSLQLEREVFGADHLQVAGRLGIHWHYPPPLMAAIEHHHGSPADAPAAPRATVADAVAVADAWAWALGYPSSANGTAVEIDPTAAARLNLPALPADADRPALKALVENAVAF